LKTAIKSGTVITRVPAIPFRINPLSLFLSFADVFVVGPTLINTVFRAAFAVVLTNNGNSPDRRSRHANELRVKDSAKMCKVKRRRYRGRRSRRRSNGRKGTRFTVKVTPALLKICTNNTCPIRL